MNLEKLQAALSKFKTYHSNFPRVTIDKSWNCFSNSNTRFWLQVKQIFWDLFTTASFFFRGEAYYSTWNEVVFTSCWRWGKIFKAGPHIVFEGENSSSSPLQSLLTRLFSPIVRSPTLRSCVEADMKFSEISGKLSLLPLRNVQEELIFWKVSSFELTIYWRIRWNHSIGRPYSFNSRITCASPPQLLSTFLPSRILGTTSLRTRLEVKSRKNWNFREKSLQW